MSQLLIREEKKSIIESIQITHTVDWFFVRKHFSLFICTSTSSAGVSVLRATSSQPISGIARILMNALGRPAFAQMVCAKTWWGRISVCAMMATSKRVRSLIVKVGIYVYIFLFNLLKRIWVCWNLDLKPVDRKLWIILVSFSVDIGITYIVKSIY